MTTARAKFEQKLDDTLARALSHAESVLRSYGATEDEVAEELSRLSARRQAHNTNQQLQAPVLAGIRSCVAPFPEDRPRSPPSSGRAHGALRKSLIKRSTKSSASGGTLGDLSLAELDLRCPRL